MSQTTNPPRNVRRRRDGTVRSVIAAYLPGGLATDARIRAVERGMKISDYVAEAIREKLDREEQDAAAAAGAEGTR